MEIDALLAESMWRRASSFVTPAEPRGPPSISLWKWKGWGVRTLSAEQRQFLESAVSQYQEGLRVDTSAQAYLTSRGIGPEAASTFRLGSVANPLTGHEGYRGRLCIPFLTPSGPVALTFRCTQSHDCKEAGHPKYLKPAGQEDHLFNVVALKADSPYIVVCEGEIDAITMTMCGIPAVGLSGVNAWRSHFKYCFDDFDTVYSAADPDEAGQKLTSFLAKELDARALNIPRGEDVNGIFVGGGASAVRGLIP